MRKKQAAAEALQACLDAGLSPKAVTEIFVDAYNASLTRPYCLVKIARGKKTVIKTGTHGELQNRLKQLRSGTRKGASGRGGKKYPVRYEIVPGEKL
jgi:hypothetical protein